MLSEDNRQETLIKERDYLLKAWLSAEGSNKMSLLVRIDDIDEELGDSGKLPEQRIIRRRKFIRR